MPKRRSLSTILATVLGLLLVLVLVIFYRYYQEQIQIRQDRPYVAFISNIKEGWYLKAYDGLYPLVLAKDSRAMQYIADAYQSGYGIEKDLIKANIWALRSQCACFETGQLAYAKFLNFLTQKNHGMAAAYLQRAATDGHLEAISKIKGTAYLSHNQLSIDEQVVAYWQRFDVDALYPFATQIKSYNANQPLTEPAVLH